MNPIPHTPVLVKRTPDLEWPESESTFYVLSRGGLYVCRNHEFFKSCAPARTWPCELATQRDFLEPRYPVLPRRVFERIVGFFARIGTEHGAEAAVLLVWDRKEERVRVVVPEQEATVSQPWADGRRSPLDVKYEIPTDLPPHYVVFGDVHSHVDLTAYASATDIADEEHRPGLHIVVGRISAEPPQIHVDAVVDGARFRLGQDEVIEGYERRDLDVPAEWIERVTITEQKSTWFYPSSSGGGYYSSFHDDDPR